MSSRKRFSAPSHLLLMSVARTVPRVGHPAKFTVGGGTMTHINGSLSLVLRRIVLAACALALVAATVPAEAGQRRARLSRDLRERLAARVDASSDIIVSASDAQIQILATRYGARIKKRLRNAAVLEVTGGQLRDLSEDADVSSVSGDLPVRTMATVTAEAIGADQVWEGAVRGDARLHRPRHRRGGHRHRRRRAASAPARPRRAQPRLHRRAGARPRRRRERPRDAHRRHHPRRRARRAHRQPAGDGRGRLGAHEQRHRGDRLGDRQPARVEHQDRQRLARPSR